MISHRKRPRRFPLRKLFPNMVTIAGLCAGLTSLRFAMLERWEYAVGFLILAAIIDGLDGRIARLLDSTSTFGAQLDSLSDIVCFGVAPALIMYLWSLHDVRGAGWAVAMFFTVCCALRLARTCRRASVYRGQPSVLHPLCSATTPPLRLR